MIVSMDPTPNPNSYKITVDRPLTKGGKSESYFSPAEAEKSPLAKACFAVPGVKSVFILNNFITVGRDPSTAWEELLPAISQVIERQGS